MFANIFLQGSFECVGDKRGIQHTVMRYCFVGKKKEELLFHILDSMMCVTINTLSLDIVLLVKKKKREELFMHSLDSVMCVRCKRRIGSVIIILPELERIKRTTDNETITIHEMMSLMLQHIESVQSRFGLLDQSWPSVLGSQH